jgi:hypothetical protein
MNVHLEGYDTEQSQSHCVYCTVFVLVTGLWAWQDRNVSITGIKREGSTGSGAHPNFLVDGFLALSPREESGRGPRLILHGLIPPCRRMPSFLIHEKLFVYLKIRKKQVFVRYWGRLSNSHLRALNRMNTSVATLDYQLIFSTWIGSISLWNTTLP